SAVHITLDRPTARNAMTQAMYGRLRECLDEVSGEDGVRVVVLRGAGGSFVAGTDIAHFTRFTSAEDGIAYERTMEEVVRKLETLAVPTVAVVEGAAVGGGLILAAVCDLRIATPDARFGMPIARTVGHGLSVANHARLIAHLGPGRTKALLLLAELVSAEEALRAGFVHEVVEMRELDDRVEQLCARIASHAPLTLQVTKEAVDRVLARRPPDEDDAELLRRVYGSSDFRTGVRAFLEKRAPRWEGR
ncbi:MAG TPA: enoyl-CoA hydratase, partial [Longimicrobiales bacterium]|nr:enoyl-CoA hydratase [Longimicrobiales bacterium]